MRIRVPWRRLGPVIPGALVAVGALAAAIVAYREGGGADGPGVPPRAPVVQASEGKAARALGKGSDAYQEKLRLIELLGEARVEAPNLRAAQAHLAAHWRKMPTPWLHLPREAASMAYSVALRTSRSETQWSVHTASGGSWTPDARTWNMNEGSFDQREAIFAPTPSTVSFKVTIPPAGRFDFAPGLAANLNATTIFAVTVVDAGGAEHEVYRQRVQAGDAQRWVDARVDLAAYAGQTVELRLKASHEKPAPGERHWALAEPSGDAGADAGEAEPPPAPMALALWGNPTLLGKEPTAVPYNVLWVVVDALRPDVLASFHDDAEDQAKLAAPRPPFEALLPKMPGLTPNLDALAARGVRFTHAYSAAAWTRPGTLAMLSGMRSTELGINTLAWIVPPANVSRYYASEPPLLPLLLRDNQVVTRGFVNNFFMIGYAAVGLDMGFERIDDHRYRTRDTLEITDDAVGWLKANADDRFFLFVNYNSPHEPYDPPDEFLARVPPPPAGPADPTVRRYVAEAGKDDQAIGVLLKTLEELKLTESTLVIVTADHGETLSSAHAGFAEQDKTKMRFHHAVGCFEETTRIPILMALPRVLDGGRAVTARVRNIDIAPTVLDLEGLEANAKMTGKSLLPLARGGAEPDERVVVSEGRGMRAILSGKWRLVVREGAAQHVRDYGSSDSIGEELFELEEDPGERHDVARSRSDVVAEMRARLDAALKNVPAAGTHAATAGGDALPAVHLRFAGGGRAHRISGTLTVGAPATAAPPPDAAGPTPVVRVDAVGVPPESFRVHGGVVEIALTTSDDGVVGADVRVDPPGAPLTWSLYLDDQPWPEGLVFAGPFGLAAVAARKGIATDEARAEVYAPFLPEIDPARDLGLFVARDRRAGDGSTGRAEGGEAAKEMNRILQDWGYAHGGTK